MWYVYTHVYVGICSHVCVEIKGRHQVSCSIMVHLVPVRQDLSRHRELGWRPVSPVSLLSLTALGLQMSAGPRPSFYVVLEAELRSSRFEQQAF